MAFWNRKKTTDVEQAADVSPKSPLVTEINVGKQPDTKTSSESSPVVDRKVQDEDAAKNTDNADELPIDLEKQSKLAGLRTKLHERFGKVALALMTTKRYQNLSINDLRNFVLNPMLRDRIAMAAPANTEGKCESLVGIAFWASVSPEVNEKITEQVKAGAFPIRLQPNDWNSGDINWLLDVIAPNKRLTTAVIANFRQVAKQGDLRIHPIVSQLVEADALKKMGAKVVDQEKVALS